MVLSVPDWILDEYVSAAVRDFEEYKGFVQKKLIWTRIFTVDYNTCQLLVCNSYIADLEFQAGSDPEGAIEAIALPKTHESNFIHHEFVQFEK